MVGVIPWLVETGSAKTPDEFQELHTSQQKIEKTLNDIQNSDTGITHIKASLANAIKQVFVTLLIVHIY